MSPTAESDLLSIQQAAAWASSYLKRQITPSNISYLVQYGKVRKMTLGGVSYVRVNDLKDYYSSRHFSRIETWKRSLGNDLNWALSFDNYKEKETTKHVHRLHPYKGKFIPQLVEYFLDDHVDDFKTSTFFKKGDIILDPFLGSGTTSIQAYELGYHSIGVDVSRFNCMIAECKIEVYDLPYVRHVLDMVRAQLDQFEADHNIKAFDAQLTDELNKFNNQYFPSPQYKYDFQNNTIDSTYIKSKENDFLGIYTDLVNKYHIRLNHSDSESFLSKWYVSNVRDEMMFVFDLIKKIEDRKTKKLIALILSRTIRSCRATTHSDLATLKSAQLTTYYCYKHFKICKPIFSIKNMFNRYATDTIFRLEQFDRLRTNTHHAILTADSRTVNILDEVKKRSQKFYELLGEQKIKGIFTSPPYVGQIDYHEQHAYAYELLGLQRNDELEIGPLYKGQGLEARRSYIDGVSKVLVNCLGFMCDDPEIFLVANDKYNLYPEIAELSGLKIVNQFKRPVLNRTERDKSPYSEIIFHLRRLG